MANTKQARKRHRQSLKRRARNKAIRTFVRNAVKRARRAMEAGALDDQTLRAAVRAIDRAASKGVLHRRTASRKVSRLMLAANRARARS